MIYASQQIKLSLLLITIVVFSSISGNLFSEITQSQRDILETLPPDQRDNILSKMEGIDKEQTELDEFIQEKQSLVKRPELKESEEEECEECIFGYEYFKFAPTTFAPTSNSPVTSSYILGPGDKLSVNLFGNNQSITESYISREGVLFIPSLGPVNLMGMSYSEGTNFIKNKVSNELIGTSASISILELRPINVFILGEAYKPGKYTMSALSSISNALFISGGVSQEGSLRNIEIKRQNKIIGTYDFYDFLLNGSTDSDIKLQDGDVIFIPFINRRVKLGGAFKRPGIYEFVDGETIGDAILLAGGFSADASRSSKIELSYIDQQEYKRKYDSISSDEYEKKLTDGHILNMPINSSLRSESIILTGEFNNPGEYSIRPGDTILDIIERAGGVTNDGYIEGAVFLRKRVAESQKEAFLRSADELENTILDIVTNGTLDNITEFTLSPLSNLITRLREEEPLGRMVVDIDYLGLKTNPYQNFLVRDKDSLFVPKRPNSISVAGEVLYSSTIGFEPTRQVQDYIELSGGLKKSADKDKIFIILPNGKSQLIKKGLFASKNTLLPGSTIVVSRDSRPFDLINLTEIVTPILADLATSAAAIAAISD